MPDPSHRSRVRLGSESHDVSTSGGAQEPQPCDYEEAMIQWQAGEGNADKLHASLKQWKAEFTELANQIFALEQKVTIQSQSLNFFEQALRAQVSNEAFTCPICFEESLTV